MRGTIGPGSITRPASVQFAVAGQEHDSGIRRLLRENPMRGEIALSLEREPDYFKGQGIAGAEEKTIVALEKGRVVCVGNCAVRDRFVNRTVARIGYLGALRLDRSVEGRFDILRRGYQFFSELEWNRPPELYFTSITADNVRARKFLEAQVRGMPEYKLLGNYVTAVWQVARAKGPVRNLGVEVRSARSEDIPIVVEFLKMHGQGRHFSTVWQTQSFAALQEWGLSLHNVFLAFDRGQLAGVAGTWDQSAFKQTVIRGYSGLMQLTRPAFNVLARLRGSPALPPIGEMLRENYVFPLAALPGNEQSLLPLIQRCIQAARESDCRYLVAGCGEGDPVLDMLRGEFRCREYASRIYSVHWPGSGRHDLDRGLISPEVCFL